MTSLSEKALYTFLRVHDTLYQRTNGWIGHRIPGAPPSLLLHTVGAKTGAARVNALSYAKDGDDYLVVASKGGDPKAPGWYHNLKAQPEVTIEIGIEVRNVTAHELDNAERDAIWPRVVALMPQFGEYQKTSQGRIIPLFRLDPR